MKNVQVIDGANNASYDIYSCTEEEFIEIFPGRDQNIEFIEDLIVRLGQRCTDQLFSPIWRRPIKKPDVVGIHGTLFYELRSKKLSFYPNKRESDLDKDGRGWVHG